jgi:hypothetical protein
MSVRGRLAWGLAIVSVVAVLLDVAVSAQAVPLLSETSVAVHGFPFVHGAVVGSAVMGALIVARYERHPIGWLLLAVGVAGSLSLVTEAYAYWVQEAGGPGPESLASVAAWLSALLGGQLETAAIALMFLLAPDGRLLTRRWRAAVWLVAAGTALCVTAVLTLDPTRYVLVTSAQRVGPVRSAMLFFGFLAIGLGLLVAVVSMVIRLRRSTGEQHGQLRLIAIAAALPAGALVWMLVVQELSGGRQTWLAALPLSIAFFCLPLLFAVAVLRHRLYELDVIINRTAIVLTATGFAAVGYTTLVVTVSSLIGRETSGLWLSLLTTALVAVAFQPVRRRVVRFANRLAYGSRAQPYEELADFTRRLVGTPTVDGLLPAVAAATGEALGARSASASLGGRIARWGDGGDDGTRHEVAVTETGSIAVTLPRGRRLRAADEGMLAAVGQQAEVAFRNVTMEQLLADQVSALRTTNAELARSRARLVEADDAVRRDLEAAIARDVLPHLTAVAEGLRRGDDVEPLVAEVNTGLEALRDLTRGVFPMQLTRSGVEAALRGFPLTVDHELRGRRFPARVEAAIYYCCTQAHASSATLTHGTTGTVLTLSGVTEVPRQVLDRVEAAGGSVALSEIEVSVLLPDLP